MSKKSVLDAEKVYHDAAIAYDKAADAAYPSGTIVNVKLGGHVVTLKSSGVRGAFWSTPGQLCGVNVKTGKIRTFYASEVIEDQSHE